MRTNFGGRDIVSVWRGPTTMFLVEIPNVMYIKCPPIPQGAVKTDSEHPGARPDPHRNEKDRSRAQK